MQAHAKIILIGEHSVVYGHSAIALPIPNLTVDCQIIVTDTFSVESSYANGPLHHYQHEPFYHAIITALDYLHKPKCNLHFKINSMIPYQRGLGSSAAVSISIIRTIFAYYHTNLSDDLLYELSFKAETVAHSNPSGLDLILCANNTPYLFSKQMKKPFPFTLNAYLLIIDSGITGKTKTAVELVKKHYNQTTMNQLGQLCYDMQNAIKNNNLSKIGQILNKAHTLLSSFHIVPDEIQTLVNYLQKHTLGAKMSGGGLGGCVIALVDNLETAQTIQNNLNIKGENKIWIQKI